VPIHRHGDLDICELSAPRLQAPRATIMTNTTELR
jgi:hypothetical protein